MILEECNDMDENKKNNYRITFHDGPDGNRSKYIDVYAKSSDEAFDIAYKMPEARRRLYDNVMVEKIPTEPSTIGVEIEYYDTQLKRNFTDRLFIRAENEKQAIDYYNKHFKGGRFGLYANMPVENGKCIRGRVLRTYFTGLPGYDADATVPEKTMDLNEKILKAKNQQPNQRGSIFPEKERY